ncbi:SseB family protein [Streptomyces sp. H34-S4]|uniref:SseB family protein n=1 Tax=Streptomyces sp. H34-S4 TaxID=2996463 RepID=UPI00227059AB|nr:SseB family protein [Streptomyces sp. H34-S4]MCY0937425.1 SseB family protein [Streptomyces sp. H34-S4]
MELTGEIAAIRDGPGDPARLLGEFRRAALLVPLADGPDGGLMSAVSGGIRWIYAFTDEEALARFAAARGEADAGREWEYLSVLGTRLVDAVAPAADGPAGVVVNVADEDGSMFFPPVAGIVPEGSAVDPAGRGEAA